MGKIQTNIGLITGMPIGDTVDKLMQLSAKPRDMLAKRTNTLREEQFAVTELAAYLTAVKFITESLSNEELYDQREATSSDSTVLSATVTGDPPKGAYQFTPLRAVQTQQMLSSGFRSDSESLGGGKLTFRFGDHVQRTTPLELFGGGQGVTRGRIQITDRSGARTQIDLSTVQTVDDVLAAINNNMAINVTAVAHGDRIRLIDNTGQAASNLSVQEVSGGTTAASLGLAGIDVAAGVADGRDMLWLYEDLELDALNDGSGVEIHAYLPEIQYRLREDGPDAKWQYLDFSTMESEAADADRVLTLGDVLEVFNSAAPGKLKAEIAPDGDRLIVTDLTDGTGAFELSGAFGMPLAGNLGLEDGQAVDGAITGGRLLGGVKSVLLSSLNGGRGFGPLGMLELSDRDGVTDVVDLSRAETLEDVIGALNTADVGIRAQLNRARTGIELIDTTAAHAGNLIVANADGLTTAENLGIAVDADVTMIGSGDMHLQVVAHNTRLDDLNGGAGVDRGNIRIVDSSGRLSELNLRDDEIQTIGDVIRAISRLSVHVTAEINPTGDGIRIRDLERGNKALEVHQDSTATTAEDLHLFRVAEVVDVDGQPTQVIDGSMTFTIDLDDGSSQITESTLLVDLNGGLGVAAGTFSIVDSSGHEAEIDLGAGYFQTIGAVIRAINRLPVNVVAEFNDERDGILLRDLAGGIQTMRVIEGDDTAARDLRLLGEAETIDLDGESTQVIDGAGSYASVKSLDDLRRKINSLNAGVTATMFVDGSRKPFRLSLISNQAGSAGQLVVDTSQLKFSIDETVRGRNALMVFGDAQKAASSVLISSSSNTFRGVLSGLTLQLERTSSQPVMINVDTSDVNLVANVKTLVTNYTNFREKLNELTAYDEASDTKAVLFGDAAALRLDTELSYLISGRFLGAGSIQSLAELGVNIGGDGTLSFDESKLKAWFAEDPSAVKEFFTNETFGVSAKFNHSIEQLSGQDVSLLAQRFKTLQDKIDRNDKRIEFFNERLEMERNRLYLQFYRMELAIGKLQAGLWALDAIQPLTPMVNV